MRKTSITLLIMILPLIVLGLGGIRHVTMNSPATPSPKLHVSETIYSEGFESDDGSYTHTGTVDQWEWGIPTSGPGSAHSGSKCWATNLDEDVPRGVVSDSYLTSAAISIPVLAQNEIARVRFFGWIEIDEMFDRGEFQVSQDGQNWQVKAEFFYIMLGDWTEYYFDISDYAGGNVYLRFKLYVDIQEAFWIEKGYGPSFPSRQYPQWEDINMAGWYIDDLAIIITETPTIQTTLTLEAWENQFALASCPWVYTWNGEGYVSDNDVYSTARGETKEFTDYYTLNNPLVSENGQYLLELRETEDESSYTDLVQLMTIDHESGVEIAADDNGNVWTYSSPNQPDSAIDDEGNDILSQISAEDDGGFQGYNDDYIVLDFSSLDITNGATFVLRVQGFLMNSDTGAGEVTSARPWVHVQTQDANGFWVTRNEFYPRMEWSTSAYDLSGYMTTSKKVRLYITSCHEGKFHVIDYVGLDTASQASTTVNILSATSAVHPVNGDVLDLISSSDDIYASMTPNERIAFAFDVPDPAGAVRDFVFVSEGYYVPMGTFFIYTWDGTGWAQRDAWSVEGSIDQTKDFDLSLWLPDPDGEYKVRIWQDYWYNDARIDYVGLTQVSPIHGIVVGILDTAVDHRIAANRDVVGPTPWDPAIVKARISASDNQWLVYAQEPSQNYYTGPNGYIQRDRWLEVTYTGLIVNDPPTTNPVIVTDILSPTPTISWTYGDANGDPQVEYEVEVWTESGGTGISVWDPSIGTGTDTFIVYAGIALERGQTYFARVRASDGVSWGTWSEGSWTFPANQPPLANADGPYTINEGDSLALDASSSSDPDGDILTYNWDLDNDFVYGDVTGVTSTIDWITLVSYGLDDDGTYTIGLEVDDGVETDTVLTTINIFNVNPTITEITVSTDLITLGTSIDLTALFTDPGTADTHTAAINWGDGTIEPGTVTEADGSGTVTASHTYDTGVFTINLTVEDDDGGGDTEIYQYIVVYDPNDGFVTGGGWINSPEGAYYPDPTLTGTANFGFVAKYKNGMHTPIGNTEFQFQVADLNFHSSSYEWLVVANHKAIFKGTGTINGDGNYGFMLYVIDAKLHPTLNVDMFRMKIWDKDNNDAIVYDSGLGDNNDEPPTTEIAGGQVVIHK